jgi:hypothetical protein
VKTTSLAWCGKGRTARTLPLALALLGFALNSRAATTTWLGNASINWSTAANWSGSSVPTANDSLVFTNAGTAGASLNNDIPAGRVFNGITFSLNALGAYVFSGNAFGLNGTIANSSPNLQTINNAIILTNAGTLNASAGSFMLGGTISDNGSHCNLTLTGGKGVTLSGSNTFGGTLNLYNGTALSIGAASNLGTGTNISFGGSSSSSISATASLMIPGSTTITVGSGSTAAFATPTAWTF